MIIYILVLLFGIALFVTVYNKHRRHLSSLKYAVWGMHKISRFFICRTLLAEIIIAPFLNVANLVISGLLAQSQFQTGGNNVGYGLFIMIIFTINLCKPITLFCIVLDIIKNEFNIHFFQFWTFIFGLFFLTSNAMWMTPNWKLLKWLGSWNTPLITNQEKRIWPDVEILKCSTSCQWK